MRIGVLGATGMLGSQVLATLESAGGHEITATVRSRRLLAGRHRATTRVVALDAQSADDRELGRLLCDCDWWINCIGTIKPYIHDDDPTEVGRAIAVNSLFSANLAAAADASGARLIQVGTDCVWDGVVGGYDETAPHNALDVYGRSKSLGEVRSANSHVVRCSMVGRELHRRVSLLEWFLGQPRGAVLNGFTNHYWNGVTTLQFARVCAGIVAADAALPFMQHLVPADAVSKHELLCLFARHFGRDDVEIRPHRAVPAVDRTLATIDPAHNAHLWRLGGYDAPPTIEQMVAELAGETVEAVS